MTEFKTPQEERDFHIYYAKVMIAESRRRSGQPRMQETLLQWAANGRRRAAAVDVKPKQGEMFK